MTFNLNILALLSPTPSQRSTPTQDPPKMSINPNTPLPRIPLKVHEKPTSQVLPCGCLRSHVLISQLSPIPESTSLHAESTTSSASLSSTTTSSSPGLHRPNSPLYCPQPPLKTQFRKTCEFHYYLPHVSSSTSDLYSSSEFVAFGINDSNNGNDIIDANDTFEPPTSPTYSDEFYETVEGVRSLLELPYIGDEDFEYYPRREEVGEGEGSVRGSSEGGNSFARRSRGSRVSAWSGATKRGSDVEALEGKKTFSFVDRGGDEGDFGRRVSGGGVKSKEKPKGKRLQKKKAGEEFFLERVVRRLLGRWRKGKERVRWNFRP
ncbi:hypothetical protein P154DRAFT_602012 [Amniculicola lignicola CBS 123094]|uniref:Uncharacterized protein n=1 Tax=Amniculicola lignicola CBS 123094 TaxID=1392246 RepID=A0A6A5WBD7_9PLEO|nr:hypothetical protein P154DRAFT_602012 [Amniculicola lignicola CBS 123094]